MIANKIRHYRRYLPYPLIPAALLVSSPALVETHYLLDASLDIVGAFIACWGAFLRAWAWGTNRAEPSLRVDGPYAFIRHPLYTGNFLIALGLLIIFNAPLAYLIVLPPLAFLYWIITEDEENRLEAKWGRFYAEYRAKVPRFLPWRGRVLGGDQEVSFRWKQMLRKERESICAVMAGAIGLKLYEEVLCYGFKETQEAIFLWGSLLLLLGLFTFGLHLQKKKTGEK